MILHAVTESTLEMTNETKLIKLILTFFDVTFAGPIFCRNFDFEAWYSGIIAERLFLVLMVEYSIEK